MSSPLIGIESDYSHELIDEWRGLLRRSCGEEKLIYKERTTLNYM